MNGLRTYLEGESLFYIYIHIGVRVRGLRRSCGLHVLYVRMYVRMYVDVDTM